MKQIFRIAFVASFMLVGSALAADVSVSVAVGDPNFYGRIDINNSPSPQIIYAQPVIIERTQVVYAPVYLRVPPGHEKHWAKHCKEYNACGRKVYFVQDSWYSTVYVPSRKGHGKSNGNGKGHGKSHGKGK